MVDTEDTILLCFCKTFILFLSNCMLSTTSNPIPSVFSHSSYLLQPFNLAFFRNSFHPHFLEIIKIKHSTPSEDLTVLTIANTTPCVSHMTLLCLFLFSFFFFTAVWYCWLLFCFPSLCLLNALPLKDYPQS